MNKAIIWLFIERERVRFGQFKLNLGNLNGGGGELTLFVERGGMLWTECVLHKVSGFFPDLVELTLRVS